MGERIRITSDNPPLHLLDQYPNWENCWDEEGDDDLDETTLRPSANQAVIHEDVTFTAGDVTFADGRCYPAILAGFGGEVEDIWVYSFEDPSKCWGMAGELGKDAWSAYRAESNVEPTPNKEVGVFPVTIKSRLPLEASRKPIQFRVTRTEGEC